MTIDLKWFLPFILPMMLPIVGRAAFWLAGAEIARPEVLAVSSIVVGGLAGSIVATFMWVTGEHLRITLGKDRR